MSFLSPNDYSFMVDNHLELIKKWKEREYTEIIKRSSDAILDIISVAEKKWLYDFSESTKKKLSQVLK